MSRVGKVAATAAAIAGGSATAFAQEVSGIKLTPYVDGGYTRVEDKRAISPSTTDNWQATLGIDASLTSWLDVGGGVIIGGGNTDFGAGPSSVVVTPAGTVGTSQVVNGDTDTESWTLFGRATVTLPNGISFGGIAGYAESEADELRNVLLTVPGFDATATQTWKRDSDTKFVGGNLSYTHRIDRWFVVPGVRVLYSTTHGGAYSIFTNIDDIAAFNNQQVANVAASDDDYLRGHIGSDIGYFFTSGNAYIVPIFKAYWAHDFDLPDGFTDRDAADLSASINYIQGGLTFGGEFQTTVGRDETETYGGRAYLLYKF